MWRPSGYLENVVVGKRMSGGFVPLEMMRLSSSLANAAAERFP